MVRAGLIALAALLAGGEEKPAVKGVVKSVCSIPLLNAMPPRSAIHARQPMPIVGKDTPVLKGDIVDVPAPVCRGWFTSERSAEHLVAPQLKPAPR